MSAIIGGTDQRDLVGASKVVHGGYGAKPSLPHRLRNYDPKMGPPRVGEILPGDNEPLTVSDVVTLERHFNVHAYRLPDREVDVGAFVACVDQRVNFQFHQWMQTPVAFRTTLHALMMAVGEFDDLGIGVGDIQALYANPGPKNSFLIEQLPLWCRHPRVRFVLDGVVADLRARGWVPLADGGYVMTKEQS